MLEVISEYIDLELALIIVLAIGSFIFLNILFRKVSMPVIIKNGIVICIIGVIGFLSYNYLEKEEVAYIDSLSNNYIVGKVQFVGKSVDKVNIKYVNSNIPVKNKGEITVHITAGTRFILKQGYEPEVEVTIDELKLGDVVTVYCKENSLNNGETEITARKIIKKES